jgi:hypothetical protein
MLRKNMLLRVIPAFMDWIVCSPWRSFFLLLLLSFSIHINQLNKISSRYLIPDASRELGAIAISLAETGQFSDPYMMQTGPTAHLPPIIPGIIGMIYRWFGLTAQAGYLSKLLVITNGSMLYAALPWLSRKLGLTRQAGLIGGIAGILLMEWHGHGEHLTGIAMGLIMVAFLRRWKKNRINVMGSIILGLGIGVSFHIQPAILPVVLGCILFELFWLRNRRKWLFLGVLALGIGISCIPWGWRNYTTFNEIFFIRSNFGLELRLGNRDGTSAIMDVMVANEEPPHPKANFAEARLLREVGEMEYMRQARQEAWEWIRTNPAEFFWLTGQRFANFWFGPLNPPEEATNAIVLTIFSLVGAWRSFPGLKNQHKAILLIPLATYPLVYYVVPFLPRYRAPIDWILFILAGTAIWSWIGEERGHNVSRRAGINV